MSRSTIVLAVLVAILLAGPMLIVVPMSFSTAPSLEFPPSGFWLGYYRRFFSDPNWTGPLFNSFQMEADPAISAASSLLLAAVLVVIGARWAARLVKSQQARARA